MVMKLVFKILDKWPLRKQLGYYAYMPAFFAIGASVEFVMIKMRVGNVDFYSVYLEKERARLQEEAQYFIFAIMPFGLAWSTYLSRVFFSLMAVAAGSQFVHSIYKPIDNRLNRILDEKKEKYTQQLESSKPSS